MNKGRFFIFALFTLLLGCKTDPVIKELHYQNIVILSDLSSRMTNRPSKDTAGIFELIDFFRNKCVKPGEKIGDRSSIRFNTFSGNVTAGVDLDEIKELGDKQQFINSTGKYRKSGLDQRLADFKQTVVQAYQSVRDPGLDLISMLIEKIEKEPIVKSDVALANGRDTTYINYENHVYIFTDGYLEYGQPEQNNQFYFGKNQIEKVRKYCIQHNIEATAALEADRSLGLPAYKKEKNKLITLHLLETHERDKDEILQKYSHDVGRKDNEILEAVWKKWARESGFIDLIWEKY